MYLETSPTYGEKELKYTRPLICWAKSGGGAVWELQMSGNWKCSGGNSLPLLFFFPPPSSDKNGYVGVRKDWESHEAIAYVQRGSEPVVQ